MTGRALVASVVCFGLAACGTDKISMSSEVGGSGTSRVFALGGGGGGDGGGACGDCGGPGLEGNDPGLGVVGDGGVLDNVVGADPIGGVVDDILGPGNPVSAILGSGSGSGLIPSAAAMLAGDPNAEIVGLGITGEGGIVADLTGADLLGGLLDDGGLVGASIAGGNDGLLGALLNEQAANPPLAPVAGPLAGALPLSILAGALAGLPALGVTGGGGLVADLVGTDLGGGLLGSNTPVGGGNDGLLGDLVPAGNAQLAPLGDALTGTLNVIAGNEPSPLAGLGGQLGALPVLDGILGDGAGSLGGVLSPVTGVLGGAPAAPGGASGGIAPAPAAALEPLTGLPIVGGLLGSL